MKRFNRNLYPTGGRYFLDEDGVKHKGDNWDQLTLKVTNYRKKAGKPPGDPKAEIQAQVCARLPHYCQEDAAGPPPITQIPRSVVIREPIGSGRLTERVVKWLASMLSTLRAGGVGRVSRSEASKRAAVCAQCPMNRGLNQSCGTCNRSRREAANALVKGERVNAELGGCRVLGVDNSVAVHLDLPRDNSEGLPGHCWRRG